METATPDSSAVLVRVPVAGTGSSRALPPAPSGSAITVTFGSERLVAGQAPSLQERGYRLAGVVPAMLADPADVLDVLVPAATISAHPGWFASLLGHASRVFDCDLGPVQLLFRDELSLHRRALLNDAREVR